MTDEYTLLRTAALAFDLSNRGRIELTGRDRVRFLHHMCTNDIQGLKPGEGCYATMVTRQGKMTGDFQVKCLEESLLLDGEPEAITAVRESLQNFIIMDDVRITDRTGQGTLIALHGPKSREALGTPLPDLKEFHFVREGDRLISRRDITGAEGYEVWSPNPWKPPVPPGSFQTYEIARIENGFPRWGIDMGPDLLPMEAGLEPIAISYTKGCYIGQEVIQRVKTYSEPVQMLVSLELEETSVPPRGTPILAGGKEAGQITSAALTPRGVMALGVVRKDFKTPGTKVRVTSSPAVVSSLKWSTPAGPAEGLPRFGSS